MREEAKASKRAPVRRSVDAVVVGAGFGGLYMVHRLREAGYSVQAFEAGDGVGGTWYWNRYPGARCDVPSLYYSYSFSPELQSEWTWSQRFAPQPEILAYANHVADRFDLRPSFLFETRVTSARYDDAADRWTVETDQGDVVEARFCVMATGCLSLPREPDLPGVETFRGDIHLTSRWPHHPVDFKGKRVALIGTGSSGIQSTPVIAKEAAQLYVFQRTPNFSLPAKNRNLTEKEVADFRANFETYRKLLREGGGLGFRAPAQRQDRTPEEMTTAADALWGGEGLFALSVFPDLFRNEQTNALASEYVRGKIRQVVADPAVAERLCPKDYPLGTKRACIDTDYFQTFNLPSVELIDIRETPLAEITPTGLRTSERAFEVDMIVFATGFDAMTGALLKMDIHGRASLSLRETWAAGPRTYLGIQVAGFPNLFTITGPGSPSVLSNMISSCEQHVDFIMDALAHMKARELRVIEARPEAQEAWVEHVNEEADKTLFPRANSWYMGANVPGKPRVFMPYIGPNYRARCEEVAARGYEGFALSR